MGDNFQLKKDLSKYLEGIDHEKQRNSQLLERINRLDRDLNTDKEYRSVQSELLQQRNFKEPYTDSSPSRIEEETISIKNNGSINVTNSAITNANAQSYSKMSLEQAEQAYQTRINSLYSRLNQNQRSQGTMNNEEKVRNQTSFSQNQNYNSQKKLNYVSVYSNHHQSNSNYQNSKSQMNVSERLLELHDYGKENLRQKMVEEKLSKDLKEREELRKCTFSPNTNNHVMKSYIDIVQKTERHQFRKKQKEQSRKQELFEKQVRECTFSPEIKQVPLKSEYGTSNLSTYEKQLKWLQQSEQKKEEKYRNHYQSILGNCSISNNLSSDSQKCNLNTSNYSKVNLSEKQNSNFQTQSSFKLKSLESYLLSDNSNQAPNKRKSIGSGAIIRSESELIKPIKQNIFQRESSKKQLDQLIDVDQIEMKDPGNNISLENEIINTVNILQGIKSIIDKNDSVKANLRSSTGKQINQSANSQLADFANRISYEQLSQQPLFKKSPSASQILQNNSNLFRNSKSVNFKDQRPDSKNTSIPKKDLQSSSYSSFTQNQSISVPNFNSKSNNLKQYFEKQFGISQPKEAKSLSSFTDVRQQSQSAFYEPKQQSNIIKDSYQQSLIFQTFNKISVENSKYVYDSYSLPISSQHGVNGIRNRDESVKRLDLSNESPQKPPVFQTNFITSNFLKNNYDDGLLKSGSQTNFQVHQNTIVDKTKEINKQLSQLQKFNFTKF